MHNCHVKHILLEDFLMERYEILVFVCIDNKFNFFQNFYAERFGSENIVIIKDSNAVDVNNLNPEKAFIQITYVEPYFEAYELRHRVTHFDRNYNISKYREIGCTKRGIRSV